MPEERITTKYPHYYLYPHNDPESWSSLSDFRQDGSQPPQICLYMFGVFQTAAGRPGKQKLNQGIVLVKFLMIAWAILLLSLSHMSCLPLPCQPLVA